MILKLTEKTELLFYKRGFGMISGNKGWSVTVCSCLDGRWNRRWVLLPMFGKWSGLVQRFGDKFYVRRFWIPYLSLTTYFHYTQK